MQIIKQVKIYLQYFNKIQTAEYQDWAEYTI